MNFRHEPIHTVYPWLFQNPDIRILGPAKRPSRHFCRILESDPYFLCTRHTAARNRILYEVNEKVQFSEGKALATALKSDAPGAEEDEPARKSAK